VYFRKTKLKKLCRFIRKINRSDILLANTYILHKQVLVFGLFTFYRNVHWKSPSEKEIAKNTFIYSDYLLKNIWQNDPNSHFLLKPPKTSSVKRKQTEHVYLRFRVIFGKSRDLWTILPEKQDDGRSYDNELEMNSNR
jgi:hypothetical protein